MKTNAFLARTTVIILCMLMCIPAFAVTLTATQVAQYAYNAGFRGDGLIYAIAIAGAESGYRTDATNTVRNSPPSTDRGLWQLNSYWHPEVSDTCAFDPACSAQAVYKTSSSGTSWTQWTTWNNGAYKSRLSEAQAAAAAVSGSGGGSNNGIISVPLFCQRSDPWQSSLLGFSSSDTIHDYGCVITDLAMILNYYGANTNPGDMNNWLKANGGYASQDLVVWGAVAQHGPNVSYAGGSDWSAVPANLGAVNAELDAGYPVIANVCLFKTTANHYVVIVGHSGTTSYTVNDPWDGQQHTIPDARYSNGASPSVAIWGIQRYHGSHSNPDTTPPTVTITSGHANGGVYAGPPAGRHGHPGHGGFHRTFRGPVRHRLGHLQRAGQDRHDRPGFHRQGGRPGG